ncbi:ferredoxin [Paenibacillus sp. GCM10012306]|uniref:(2Fe-2S) ferredoxin domain-containing protein n=1 Tax=Paenibacillus sp. GCM10012306 TaxID=3317342 RepID=UPI003621B61B
MTTWNLQGTQCHLLICNGSSCKKHRGKEVAEAIEKEIDKQAAGSLIHTTVTGCNGRCSDACVVIAYPEGVWYRGITPKLGKVLVRKTLKGKRLIENMVYKFDKEFRASSERGMRGKKKK